MHRAICWLPVCCLTFASALGAQPAEAVRLTERFGKDAQYHVICEVEISGTLPVPASAKEPNPKPLKVAGKSYLRYDERILQLKANGAVERTVRHYRQLEFERKVGAEQQHNKLR